MDRPQEEIWGGHWVWRSSIFRPSLRPRQPPPMPPQPRDTPRRHRRLAFCRRRPLGVRAIPAESDAYALYMQGRYIRQDPLDLTRGVTGAHQSGRPGSDLSVPVGWEGNLLERLLWLRGHATCLRSPVHVCAWGSVRQSPAQPGLPRWERVLLDDLTGRWSRGR